MWFLTFVGKNISRRPLRSGLTVAAVAIAICAVVALVGVAVGFQNSFLKLYEGAGVDLVVVRTGVRNVLTSTLDESLGDRIRAIEGVTQVRPVLREVTSFPEQDVLRVPLYGWAPVPEAFAHLEVTGRTLTEGDTKSVMLGSLLAESLGKAVGDDLVIYGDEENPYTVVGVFDSTSVFETGAMIMTLNELQTLLDRGGQVTSFEVITEDAKDEALVERVQAEIEKLGAGDLDAEEAGSSSGITALPTREHVQSLTEIRAAQGMAWLTSTIALVIGTVGMLNTMIMSVFERTREIGILRAIGWRKLRVMRMVLSEALLLSLLGGVLGTIGALGLLQLLTQSPTVGNLIEARVDPSVIGQGMLIAVVVGLLGGLLPAYNATKMDPTAAIHYE